MGMRRGAGMMVAAVAAILLVTAEAWIPLGNERVRYEREAPVAAGPFLDFQGRSVLIGDPGPAWLRRAVDTGRFTVHLRFMTFWPDQSGPARIFAISNGASDADLMIGQDGLDLVIRVRRPGADDNGTPAFRAHDVLIRTQPQELDVTIDQRSMTAVLDSHTVMHEVFDDGPAATSTWDPDQQVVIGDEVKGGYGWVGGMFEATVDGDGGDLGLIASGALQPGRGTVEFERPRVVDRPSDWSPLVAALRVLLFVPLGLVFGRRLRNPLAAGATCAGIVLVLATGKLLIPGRHPSIAEILFGMVGSAAGIALARARRRPALHALTPG